MYAIMICDYIIVDLESDNDSDFDERKKGELNLQGR